MWFPWKKSWRTQARVSWNEIIKFFRDEIPLKSFVFEMRMSVPRWIIDRLRVESKKRSVRGEHHDETVVHGRQCSRSLALTPAWRACWGARMSARNAANYCKIVSVKVHHWPLKTLTLGPLWRENFVAMWLSIRRTCQFIFIVAHLIQGELNLCYTT